MTSQGLSRRRPAGPCHGDPPPDAPGLGRQVQLAGGGLHGRSGWFVGENLRSLGYDVHGFIWILGYDLCIYIYI